jgi:hypothetical protein
LPVIQRYTRVKTMTAPTVDAVAIIRETIRYVYEHREGRLGVRPLKYDRFGEYEQAAQVHPNRVEE